MRPSLKNIKIIPNVFSDHSALGLFLSPEEKKDHRGPGFWKFSNSLLTDKDYTELISKKIPEFASKYHEVTDKGLLWEMIKMEIRAATILFSKRFSQFIMSQPIYALFLNVIISSTDRSPNKLDDGKEITQLQPC